MNEFEIEAELDVNIDGHYDVALCEEYDEILNKIRDNNRIIEWNDVEPGIVYIQSKGASFLEKNNLSVYLPSCNIIRAYDYLKEVEQEEFLSGFFDIRYCKGYEKVLTEHYTRLYYELIDNQTIYIEQLAHIDGFAEKLNQNSIMHLSQYRTHKLKEVLRLRELTVSDRNKVKTHFNDYVRLIFKNENINIFENLHSYERYFWIVEHNKKVVLILNSFKVVDITEYLKKTYPNIYNSYIKKKNDIKLLPGHLDLMDEIDEIIDKVVYGKYKTISHYTLFNTERWELQEDFLNEDTSSINIMTDDELYSIVEKLEKLQERHRLIILYLLINEYKRFNGVYERHLSIIEAFPGELKKFREYAALVNQDDITEGIIEDDEDEEPPLVIFEYNRGYDTDFGKSKFTLLLIRQIQKKIRKYLNIASVVSGQSIEDVFINDKLCECVVYSSNEILPKINKEFSGIESTLFSEIHPKELLKFYTALKQNKVFFRMKTPQGSLCKTWLKDETLKKFKY